MNGPLAFKSRAVVSFPSSAATSFQIFGPNPKSVIEAPSHRWIPFFSLVFPSVPSGSKFREDRVFQTDVFNPIPLCFFDLRLLGISLPDEGSLQTS